MLEVLSGFVAELRTAGLPVSMGEHVDAARVLDAIDLGDRQQLRAALSATLVKRAEHQETFERTFALYFADRRAPAEPDVALASMTGPAIAPERPEPSGSDIVEQLLDALRDNNSTSLGEMAELAVDRYAGIEAGRPVGAAYYLYRTMRQLHLDEVEQRLAGSTPDMSPIEQRVNADKAASQIAAFREMLEMEILERLVDERGLEAMVTATRKSLLEDIDVMQANREELAQLEKALVPLGRKLAARLAHKRRRRRRGPVDIRRTIRESLSTGGVPLDIRFRPPHPAKPEIVVLADMSGSVASFARFTLLLVHALSGEFSKVRSFVFVDGVDEVTHLFEECADPTEAADRIAAEANMIAADGHSDYGSVFSHFLARYASSLSPRATLLVLGDARSNYHPARPDALEALRRRVKKVYWLNPEPSSYWHSGDSVIAEYRPHCDEIVECRTLRQLEEFVMGLP